MPITKTFNNTSYNIPLEGELNWATLSNFLVALADYSQTINKQKVGMRVAIATPVTVLATTDCVIVTDLTTPGAVAVNLPAGVSGQVFTVVDGKGDAGTNNITITPAAGTINGAATYVIDSNRAGVSLAYNGTSWTVIAEFISSGDIPRNQIAAGSANHVVINDGSGDLSSEAALAATRGGLGTNASAFTGYLQATAGVFSAASIAAGDLPSSIDATKIADGSVTSTEFQYINSLTSNAQTQIDAKAAGAASSTDNAIARFDLATGKVIQNSGIIVDDSNNVTGVNDLTVNNNLTVNGTTVTLNTTNLDVTDKNITVNKGGNDASSVGAGLTVDRTGTKGSIIYDTTTTSKFKAGDLASEVEIATISGTQVITNKDIDGGTASNTSRITIPKDTKANLDALTRKQATVVYASDLNKLYTDDGSSLKEIGSGGSGINYLADYFSAETLGTVGNGNVTDAGNRSSGTFAAWQSTNTTDISLSVSATNPLRAPKCFLFSGSGNAAAGTKFVESPAFQLNVADLGKPVTVSFDLADVTADGNFDVCMVRYSSTGVYQEKISIAGNASGATPASAKLPLGVTKFNGFFIASSTDTDYYALRFRRLAGTDVPRLDSPKISPDNIIQGAAVTDWVSYTPVITNLPITSTNFFWRRVGDTMQVWGRAVASGAATGIIDLQIPNTYSIDITKIMATGNNNSAVLGLAEAYDNGVAYYTANISYGSSNSIRILQASAGDYWRVTVPHTWGSTDELIVNFTVPIVGWSSSVTMANRAVEEYASDDGSSDVFGISGSLVPNQTATTGATARTFAFQYPPQKTDLFICEIMDSSTGNWQPATQIYPFSSGNNAGSTNNYGIRTYWSSATTYTVEFGNQGTKVAASNVNAGSDPWSTLYTSGVRFRVRKVSGGASVGYPVSSANIIVNTDTTPTANSLYSGTYTVTHTGGTNVAAAYNGVGKYIRVGNIVYVSGRVQVDLTATGDFVSYLSLPIASNFTVEDDASGGYGVQQNAANGWILADFTNDRLQLNGTLGTASNSNITFYAMYIIK